jgi:hypothetical protein
MGNVQDFIDAVDRTLGSEQNKAQASAQAVLNEFIADLNQLALDGKRSQARQSLVDAYRQLSALNYPEEYQRTIRNNLIARIGDDLKRL